MPTKLSFADTHAAVQFSKQLFRSELWVQTAESLLAAAKELEPSIDSWWRTTMSQSPKIEALYGAELQAPHFLLVAFAIENFFKAVLVHRKHSEFKNKLLTVLPQFLRTTISSSWPPIRGFPLSISEQDLCFRLSRNSVWAGRYLRPPAQEIKGRWPGSQTASSTLRPTSRPATRTTCAGSPRELGRSLQPS